jgi:DNA replicative helicase MCM subunit Mcm2 (Cdc46/Mcm family)
MNRIAIRRTIKQVIEQADNSPLVDDVINIAAEQEDVTRQEVRDVFESLKKQGEIYRVGQEVKIP